MYKHQNDVSELKNLETSTHGFITGEKVEVAKHTGPEATYRLHVWT